VPDRAAPAEEQAKAITDVLRADLSELLVEGATWEERLLIIRVAEMFANDSEERSLAQINELGRRIEQARAVLDKSAPEAVASIEERVAAYWSTLEGAELTDDLVARFARRTLAVEAGKDVGAAPAVAPERVAWGALRVLTLPLAVAGMILYWIPYQLPRAVTRRLGGDPDVTSTYKLGVGLLVHPLWATTAIAIAFMKLATSSAILATAIVMTAPFAALPWLDRWDRLAGRLRLLAPWEDRRDVLAEIAAERSALMAALEAARAKVENP
jgi:hypothetical protein